VDELNARDAGSGSRRTGVRKSGVIRQAAQYMKRIITGFLLGYIFIEVMTAITHQLLYARMGNAQSARYSAVITATDTLLAILGGWLCATVSREALKAILALIIVGEVLDIAVALLWWSDVPHLYNFVHWIIYPAAVWFGARIKTPLSN
jgi:hypothetical protein